MIRSRLSFALALKKMFWRMAAREVTAAHTRNRGYGSSPGRGSTSLWNSRLFVDFGRQPRIREPHLLNDQPHCDCQAMDGSCSPHQHQSRIRDHALLAHRVRIWASVTESKGLHEHRAIGASSQSCCLPVRISTKP